MKAILRWRTFDTGITTFYTESVTIYVERTDPLMVLRELRKLLVSSETPQVGISLELIAGLRNGSYVDYTLTQEGVREDFNVET
jgi:hypothetical protein